jgi:hypothetical protein
VFARGPTAEVFACHDEVAVRDGPGELRAEVVESTLTQFLGVARHEEPRGDYLVRVDVVTEQPGPPRFLV